MLVENGNCKFVKISGGARTVRTNRRTGLIEARGNTRKRAGIISTRETVKSVSNRSRCGLFFFPSVLRYIIAAYISVFRRFATCIMGMMGVFKWLRKDIVQRDRNRRTLTPKIHGLNNDAYKNALQAFIDRRRNPNEPGSIISPRSPDKERFDFFVKKNNENEDIGKKKNENNKRETISLSGIPHVQAPDIFEIGWIAGTEDRYMELIYAEWQTTRVSLRRHTHPDCRNAVKADLEVLKEIRHPNVLLLMATTHTDDHGLVAIFEPIDCTLYNFVHEQGERVSIQGIAKCAGSLAGALKHAHMRGYVHGAISPHCIFLATCGTVKLGGWELAGSINSTKMTREYEERLRFEIFRWQAPELFRGQEASKATDVYGLTLVMWEMCTRNIPWNGLSKSEVERQYLQWEKGVITDLYNFPPLLHNLLDAGLQLDVSKRTLDMSRMRRFLQTLEIQYEDLEPIYVESLTNNNNSLKGSINSSMPSSTPPSRDSPPTKRCTSAQTPKRYSDRRTAEFEEHPPRSLNLNLIEDPETLEHQEASLFMRKETVASEKFAQLHKSSNRSQNVKKIRSNEKLRGTANSIGYTKIAEIPRKVPLEVTKIIVTPDVTRSVDSSDDESSPNEIITRKDKPMDNDARVNIKKIRQALASKRENFFYGSDSSRCSPSEKKIETTKSRILTEVRSKDYEPHKPASHKTCLEPKQTKSPGQFNNSTASRSTIHQSQRSPYSYVPTAIRDAVVQPKVLNTDSNSFFESSLWRKEKAICISKMRKSTINDSTFCVSRGQSRNQTMDNNKTDSAESNDTYTIDDTKDAAANSGLNNTEFLTDLSASTIPRTKSLQALKDALERATDIVRSATPHPESSSNASSPFKSPRNIESNTSGEHESIFEDIYQLKHDEPDGEIKSIERSADNEENFLVKPEKSQEKQENVVTAKNTEYTVKRRSVIRDETKRGSFDISRLSANICESIAESLNENDASCGDAKSNDTNVLTPKIVDSNETATITVVEPKATFQFGENETQDKKQDSETSFALMVFNDKTRGCNSCNPCKSNMARRRSLPAALGQLRNLSNVSLGKLPIKKGDIPDNTVEDIYIDDEFGDCLNVNMVLLDADAAPDDEDFLPDLLELSDSQEYP